MNQKVWLVRKEDQCQEYQLLRHSYYLNVIPTYVKNFKQGDSYFAVKFFSSSTLTFKVTYLNISQIKYISEFFGLQRGTLETEFLMNLCGLVSISDDPV